MGAMLVVAQVACREASVPPTTTNEPMVIAAEQPVPSAIVTDADFIYWNHVGRDLILKAPHTGGAVVTLFAGGGDFGGHSIAIDADSVYFDRGLESCAYPRSAGQLLTCGRLSRAAATDRPLSRTRTATRHGARGPGA
jgi:hypothetical protein